MVDTLDGGRRRRHRTTTLNWCSNETILGIREDLLVVSRLWIKIREYKIKQYLGKQKREREIIPDGPPNGYNINQLVVDRMNDRPGSKTPGWPDQRSHKSYMEIIVRDQIDRSIDGSNDNLKVIVWFNIEQICSRTLNGH